MGALTYTQIVVDDFVLSTENLPTVISDIGQSYLFRISPGATDMLLISPHIYRLPRPVRLFAGEVSVGRRSYSERKCLVIRKSTDCWDC